MATKAKAKTVETPFPFYPVVTETTYSFPTIKPGNPIEKIGLPVVTLPPGTVLFRSGRLLGGLQKFSDPRLFYRDYLGEPVGPSQLCLSPTQNVFFYPHPYVGFGLHGVGQEFNMVQIVVLVHPTTVVCAISPAQFVRGTTHVFARGAPIVRCSDLPYDCLPPTAAREKALKYDNCLDPDYQAKSGTRGWMAIADLDSIYPHKLRKEGKMAGESPMASYLRYLDKRKPGKFPELLAHTYTDLHGHAGFPELALYPCRKHPGPKKIFRFCRNEKEAQILLYNEAKADNLNFLPLATISREGTADMVNGLYEYSKLSLGSRSVQANPLFDHPKIETHIEAWMTAAMTTGLTLPHYGQGKLVFDSRTGFFVLEQMIPKELRLPLSEEAIEQDKQRGQDSLQTISYKSICLPLSTEDQRTKMMNYMLTFRTFMPTKFLTSYGLLKGFGARRAFLFNRPPILAKVFQLVGQEVPKEYKSALARSAAIYQEDTGRLPRERIAVKAGIEVKPGDATLGPDALAQAHIQTAGGARQTRSLRSRKTRQTRKQRENYANPAKTFQAVWNTHALLKQRKSKET